MSAQHRLLGVPAVSGTAARHTATWMGSSFYNAEDFDAYLNHAPAQMEDAGGTDVCSWMMMGRWGCSRRGREALYPRLWGAAPEDVWRQSLPRLMREGMIARADGRLCLTAPGHAGDERRAGGDDGRGGITPSVATLSCRPSKREGWFSRYRYLAIKAPTLRALSAKLTRE